MARFLLALLAFAGGVAASQASVLQALEQELFPQTKEQKLSGSQRVGNCYVTHWGAWQPCSKSCGTGVQSRTRHAAKTAQKQPAGCLMPALAEERWCATQSCRAGTVAAGMLSQKQAQAPAKLVTRLADLKPMVSSVGWGNFWTNRNWYQRGFTIAGRRYAHGIFAHAPSRVLYALNRKYASFSACVGLDDGNGDCGDGADFSVLIDGRTVWQKRAVRSGQQARCFEINVRGVSHLQLVVSGRANADCDEAEWVQAELTADEQVDCDRLSSLLPEKTSVGWGSGFTDPAWHARAFRIGGKSYNDGVAAHARSELFYKLRSKYHTFRTCAGVDDSGGNCGDGAVFAAHVDGLTKWTARFAVGDAAKCTEVSVQGASELSLTVDPLKNNHCDKSEWVDAFLCHKISTTRLVDCHVSDWGSWGECTASCGTGWSVRNRDILRSPQNGGAACPDLTMHRVCKTAPCPADCRMTEWGSWNECSRTCGGGIKKRVRSVLAREQHGGRGCPQDRQMMTCNSGSCPLDCTLSQWSGFSFCTRTCGDGHRYRTRRIVKPKTCVVYRGQKVCGACSVLTERSLCHNRGCAMDCKVTHWSSWTQCTKTCGGGHQKRERKIIARTQFQGAECPALVDSQRCNVGKCPIDCKLSVWEPWTACTVTCGGGIAKRSRSLERASAYGGSRCAHTTETRKCNTAVCPVNCKVSLFGPYSRCSVTCGGGLRVRMRSVELEPENGGHPCPHREEQQRCNLHACPEDCVVGEWTAGFFTASSPGKATLAKEARYQWSPCSVTCGSGVETRVRAVVKPAAFDGRPCPALSQSRACNMPSCTPPPINCHLGQWAGWSDCTRGCGGGTQTRHRAIEVAPQFGGKACGTTFHRRSCNAQTCPVNCVVSEFDAWTRCTRTCGGGERVRKRKVKVHAVLGGTACPALTLVVGCNTFACPVDCDVGAWSAWSKCTKTCGAGQQTRTRSTFADAKHGGKACPPLTDIRVCADMPCPVNCVLGAFGPWSKCSKSCNGGRQSRARRVLRPPSHYGTPCAHRTEERWCGQGTCPIDCELSYWGAWSQCESPVGCGTGTRTRHRIIVIVPAFGGRQCGALDHTEVCSAGACAQHCKVSKWASWSACSTTCGGGSQTRVRNVLQERSRGGATCPQLVQRRQCRMVPCPIDCRVAAWGAWSACPKSCGDGSEQRRQRAVTRRPSWMGKICPALTQRRSCNVFACPVDCVTTVWQAFTACTKECGGGTRTRTRAVTTMAANGGKTCAALSQTSLCNRHPCPVDCKVVVATAWSRCSHSCGRGHQLRTRVVSRHAQHGGKACPPLTEARWCNAHPCPVNCKASSWSSWGSCDRRWDHACVKRRGRGIAVPAANGGKQCGMKFVEEARCPTKACRDHELCSHLKCRIVDKQNGRPCKPDMTDLDAHGRPKCAPVMEILHDGKEHCANWRLQYGVRSCGNVGRHEIGWRPASREKHAAHHCHRVGGRLERKCACTCYDLPPKPQVSPAAP